MDYRDLIRKALGRAARLEKRLRTPAQALEDQKKREQRLLADIRSYRCDPSRLSWLSRTDLQQTFERKDIDELWAKASVGLRSLRLPRMTAGVNPGDQRALFYLVAAIRPRRILEIGTHIGCSTASMALALKSLSQEEPKFCGRITSGDIRDVNDPIKRPWKAYSSQESPRDLISSIGCENLVTFRVGSSFKILETEKEPFDLILLDGSHAAHIVYQEIPLALEKLANNGLIVLHDYFPSLKPLWSDGAVVPGVYLALERLREEDAGIAPIDLGELPWTTKLDSRVTSLAVLFRA